MAFEDEGRRSESSTETEAQREWAAWAAHGYRKLYQPRSIRRFGFVFTLVMAFVLVSVFWLGTHGRLP